MAFSTGTVPDSHVPVLLHEAVEALAVRPSGWYIDATYGRGGHSQYLLSQLDQNGRLLALDRDPDAVSDASSRFAQEQRFSCRQGNFAHMDEVVNDVGWMGKVDGVLMDMGVSSPQLDVAERGFGFSRDAALDMRMDPTSGQSAADWLAEVDESELVQVLRTYGEERYAKRIAAAIVRARDAAPVVSTVQLADIIKQAHPRWQRHHHPATRSFQAIRIQVNGELDAIKSAIDHAARVLKTGGRIAIISFHSLEDRLVKRALRKPLPHPDLPRHLPVDIQADRVNHPWRVLGKALKPSDAEIERNPRARSAMLRVAERVAESTA